MFVAVGVRVRDAVGVAVAVFVKVGAANGVGETGTVTDGVGVGRMGDCSVLDPSLPPLQPLASSPAARSTLPDLVNMRESPPFAFFPPAASPMATL
ncbi:MAG: hypothetical protein KatS3mg076_2147 [Candidatus Binatia bacterium]|nr:MAG: hypothetical protein KatS3mg076_2147 [Candidatus Binatia bacterium]